MKVYYVHQVVDWNGKPLDHEVSFRVEAETKQKAISQIVKETRMPRKMFKAVFQKG